MKIGGIEDMSLCRGIAGARGRKPIGIFIHNGADSKNATTAFYRNWLQTHNLENGFAHYYVCSDGILQAEDDMNIAWHCGDTNGNSNYLSIEVCQSMGDLNTFKSNEERALQLAAKLCKKYGITPSASTIRLHKEVYATACPHRSVEIHGGDSGCKAYFISRIKTYMNKTNSPQVAGRAINNTGMWYRSHIQTYGWLEPVHDGQVSGTTGKNKRLEAIKIDLRKLGDIEIEVKVHIQGIGDKTYKINKDSHDTIIGTTGKGKRIEAISMRILKGMSGKHIKYRVHVAKLGWSSWKQDGALVGSEGLSNGIQAVQFMIV